MMGGCPGGCNPMMGMMMMGMMQGMMSASMKNQGMDASEMNPMVMMQKMMSGGMGGMAGCAGCASGGGDGMAPQIKDSSPPDDDRIDPDIRELGDYFNIEERWVVRLNDTMKKRQDTKAQDLEKLYEVLEKARSPTGLLTVQIGKMECGQFVGKIKPDKDVERLARKFKLDDPVASRLTELKVWRKKNGEESRGMHDLERLEQHMRFAKRPNALCTLLVGKLLEAQMDELPDLAKAEQIMQEYKLDEDACSKMREIIEKRYQDEDMVLASVKKHLSTSANASSMLCKIARQLIDGENLPDPPERRGGGDHGGGDRDRGGCGYRGDRGGNDRDRHDRGRGDRDDRGDRNDRSDRGYDRGGRNERDDWDRGYDRRRSRSRGDRSYDDRY